MGGVRNLILVLGDQLDRESAAFDDFDPGLDAVWMAEVDEESTHVWTHKQRIALFLSAMRHFRDELRDEGLRVEYSELTEKPVKQGLADKLGVDLRALRPERVIFTQPGEWRVLRTLEAACADQGVDAEVRKDRHFFSSPEDFKKHAEGRKSLRMEYFYREMRRAHGILMDGKHPAGGEWNYDKENRGSFGAKGPEGANDGPGFAPDALTRKVLELVGKRFAKHPGSLRSFAWPVTRDDARRALDTFIAGRLPDFGRYQDAMWTDEPWLFHSLLASSLNLKLLNPREVVAAAERAYRDGHAPLPAVEGFIRQILGWREYVRGIYWLHMPDYLERNALDATEALPDFYWTGETGLECLRQAVGQTLEYGYAHHIQRLMVTGLYALLLGVDPKAVHEWYLAVYVDAVEWVELPNVLGMSQFGDGGLMASKPYVATGKYIDRMSNYCASCPKNPAKRLGEDACPFTTLYWDFLIRHRKTLKDNPRMSLQLRNVERLDEKEQSEIRRQAAQVRAHPAVCPS